MPLRNTHLYTPGLDRMVRANGERVIWTPASLCPCRINRATPDPACLMCGGFGAFWDDADTRRRPIHATVADIKLTRQLIDAGNLEKGTLILSTDYAGMPLITVNDRIEFTTRTGEPWEGETTLVTTDGRCVLSYAPVIVESVLSGNPLVGAASVVRYPCYLLATGLDPSTLPADAACYYQPGVRHLTWLADHGPGAGNYVAVRFRARLEWVAYQTPAPRFSRGTDLTELVALILKHRLLARMRDLSAGPEEAKPVDSKQRKRLAW